MIGCKRSDTEQVFVFVGFPSEKLPAEVGALRHLGAEFGGKTFKKVPGCGVGGRDRRLDIAYLCHAGTLQEGVEHPRCHPLSADGGIDGDLPNEERITLFGVDIGRYHSDDRALHFGDDTRLLEVGGDQHVTVTGVQIEGFAAIDKLIECRGIGNGWGVKVDNASFLRIVL